MSARHGRLPTGEGEREPERAADERVHAGLLSGRGSIDPRFQSPSPEEKMGRKANLGAQHENQVI
jgi:hypothetical protein